MKSNMMININNIRGQAIVGEFALVIFMILATIVAMTVYFKRGVQARIYDARNYMVEEVRSRTAGSYDGPVLTEYEPYYVNTDATITRNVSDATSLSAGETSGIFGQTFNESTTADVVSETAPPSEYEATDPGN